MTDEVAAAIGAEAAGAAVTAPAVGATGTEAAGTVVVVVAAVAVSCSRPKERHNGHGEDGGAPVDSGTPYSSSCEQFHLTLRGIAKGRRHVLSVVTVGGNNKWLSCVHPFDNYDL